MTRARCLFPARQTAASSARRHVIDTCHDLPEETREVAALLADEMVVNAFQHGQGRVVLLVARDGDRVRVEVEDESPVCPVVVDRGPLAESGRGMRLIDSMASRWGTEQRPSSWRTGKRVWFELG